jgi:polyisoprenoid-binding protein YceI
MRRNKGRNAVTNAVTNAVACFAVGAGAFTGMPTMLRSQAHASDSVLYRVMPASRFEVKTGTAGLFGFAGHDHTVRAHAFTGWVVYYPGDQAASHVELTVPAESLAVLTPAADPAEIRQVTEAMRTQVLHVTEHPVIEFAAHGSAPTAKGMRLQGELTLVGQTRPVQVDAAVQVTGDTLRASGGFSVKQTDFGIKPYRGGPAGTVLVADKVTFAFDVIAVRDSMAAPVRTGMPNDGPRR